MSDRPNAAAVLATSTIYETDGATEWTDGGQFLIEALRAAVGATEGQPVVLLGDGTLTVAEPAHIQGAGGSLWRIPGAES